MVMLAKCFAVLWIFSVSQRTCCRFLCTSLFNLLGQLERRAAGANWEEAGASMWNLIEMCRSKVSSSAERWLCSVLNDCSQQCLSVASLRADDTASATAWQTRKGHPASPSLTSCQAPLYKGAPYENINFWMKINRCTDELLQLDVNVKLEKLHFLRDRSVNAYCRTWWETIEIS